MKHLRLAAASAVLVAVNAYAGPSVDPGLWEGTVTVQREGSLSATEKAQMEQMRAHLAQVPPQYRAQMEQNLTAMADNKPMVFHEKTCVTPAMIKQGLKPKVGKNCTYTMQPKTANTYTMDFTCRDQGVESHGSGEMIFAPKSYQGNVHTMANTQGNRYAADIAMQGRWLSADCGSVKPPAGYR